MKFDIRQNSKAHAASETQTPINFLTRRSFLHAVGLGSAALAVQQTTSAQDKVIQGFEQAPTDAKASKGWKPVSDRKVRVGLVGYGVCQFGAAFGFQDHPNVEVVAVSGWPKPPAVKRPTLPSKSWSKTTGSRPYSLPLTPPVTRDTASTFSNTANTSPRLCPRSSAPSRMPTSFSTP